MADAIKKWMQDWVDRTLQVKHENLFNGKSDEWIEIEGLGRFKGLKIVSEEHQDITDINEINGITEITINLKYDEWDKNLL